MSTTKSVLTLAAMILFAVVGGTAAVLFLFEMLSWASLALWTARVFAILLLAVIGLTVVAVVDATIKENKK